MAQSIAQLFRENEDIELFRQKTAALNGAFSFEKEDMIELGNVYFERYPDCFSNRNCGEIALGYKMVRICVIEKLVAGMGGEMKDGFREMLFDLSTIERNVKGLSAAFGADAVRSRFREMERTLADIQHVIDTLPIGMIKERFIGGVSYIHNIIYLIAGNLSKL